MHQLQNVDDETISNETSAHLHMHEPTEENDTGTSGRIMTPRAKSVMHFSHHSGAKCPNVFQLVKFDVFFLRVQLE